MCKEEENIMTKKIETLLINQKVLFLIAILCSIFASIIPGFLGYANIIQIFLRAAIEGIIVIGMTYLIICREIDLSVGQIMAVSATFSVILQDQNIILAVIVSIAAGALIGLINGLIVVKLKIPSIASTLGMMVFLNGLVYLLTRSDSIYGKNEKYQLIADSSLFGIPAVIVILVVLIVIFDIILQTTVWGKSVYAIGNNINAARYSNINVDKVRIQVFVLAGTLSGVAGMLLVSRFNVASGAIGKNIPIFVILAVLLGGVSLSGGEGSVFRAFQGLMLFALIENIFLTLNIHTSYKFIVMGVILIITLSIDGVYSMRARYK
jgi:ribose transport system permease protein